MFLLALCFGCSGGNSEFVPDESWTETDSVDCWAIQLINYYDSDTKECFAAENSYGGLYLQCNNSIFRFSYPCQLISVEEFQIREDSVLLSGKSEGKVSTDGDAIFLKKSAYPYFDLETKMLTETVYLPVRMETKELAHLLTIDVHPQCEKDSANQYFSDYERKLFGLHKPRAQMYFNHLNM